MSKANSARQIYSQMRSEAIPIKIGGYKTVQYLGYTIKVYPALVENGNLHCFIGRYDTGIAVRRSLEEAKEFVHQQLSTRKRTKVKVKRNK